MRLAVVVSFLNEARFLPELLASLDRQTRLPDELLLVDDGSSDDSPAIAAGFAEGREGVRFLPRPQREAEPDRLSTAAELKAFLWGVEQLAEPWDVVTKMDADLRLAPDHFEQVLAAFEDDPRLGVCGSYLAVEHEGRVEREPHPPGHVRGPNKFYRRACFEAIAPLPPILGWDTIDEIAARMHGWSAHSIALSGGDSVHLRPTGMHDGRLRAMRRWGLCAWAYGATPVTIAAGTVARLRRRPQLLAALNYAYGYAKAARDDVARADPRILAWSRVEQRERFARLLRVS